MRVIGIDLGIRKAAYATWDTDGRDNHCELLHTGAYEVRPQLRHDELRMVRNWTAEMVSHSIIAEPEVLVFIEEPLIGNNRKYSMNVAMTYGAVLSELALLSVQVFSVNVQKWKAGTVGKGNATKDEVKNYIAVVNSSYPALCGYDQDRIDAACIGLFGVRTAARADQLQAYGL